MQMSKMFKVVFYTEFFRLHVLEHVMKIVNVAP